MIKSGSDNSRLDKKKYTAFLFDPRQHNNNSKHSIITSACPHAPVILKNKVS